MQNTDEKTPSVTRSVRKGRGVATQPQAEIQSWVELAPSNKAFQIPFFQHSVQAGFPSPADDYLRSVVSLDEELILHPAATFLVRVVGESMRDANISEGDVLIVDKALDPRHGDVVIAALDGELTVKRLSRRGGRIRLLPANPQYPVIEISPEQELVIWGVVTATIRRYRRR